MTAAPLVAADNLGRLFDVSRPWLNRVTERRPRQLLPAVTAHADDDSPLVRAQSAVRVLSEIEQAPDKAIPSDLLKDAKAIAVIPDVLKVGFVFGGRRGEGLISVKNPDGTWSNPSFISFGGGSVGFQIGVSSTDVILVFRSPRGVDNIVNGKFTLGADASVAAGPVGRTAQAATDEQLKAEIYSYSRARGLFAGVALDGTVLRIDHKSNEAVYGRGTTPRAIFEGRTNPPPTPLVDFRDRLEENTRFFRDEMTRRGFQILPGEHPIVPLMIGDAALAGQVAEAMLSQGVYVVGFSYPVVPQGKARIRTQMSAAHTRDDLQFAIDAFTAVRGQIPF